jgi:hypothetical protein
MDTNLNVRATAHGAAIIKERFLYEKLRAQIASGQEPSLAEVKALHDLRAEVKRLQPHTLRWLVGTREGQTIQVDTRDKIDWCDDHSNMTVVVGAFAEVPLRDPAAMTVKVRESTFSSDMSGFPGRESDHRMAVEILGANNDWYVVSTTRNGEGWDP